MYKHNTCSGLTKKIWAVGVGCRDLQLPMWLLPWQQHVYFKTAPPSCFRSVPLHIHGVALASCTKLGEVLVAIQNSDWWTIIFNKSAFLVYNGSFRAVILHIYCQMYISSLIALIFMSGIVKNYCTYFYYKCLCVPPGSSPFINFGCELLS